MFHCACLFDINEYQLYWFPADQDKTLYFSTLYSAAAKALKDVLGDEFDDNMEYVAVMRSIHLVLCTELYTTRWDEAVAALSWWHDIQFCGAVDLRKRTLYCAPILIDLARAFLTI